MDYTEEFKKQYEEKAKKFGLPSFDEINEDFFIQDFLNERKFVPQNTLGFTRGRMVELFGSWLGYLHGYIMPNPQSAIMMNEYQNTSDEDKELIKNMIHDMMIMQRESTLFGLKKDEKKDAEFIKTYFKLWLDSKAELQRITEKSLEIWKDKGKKEVRENISF